MHHKIALFALVALSFTACNLEKEVEIDLPDYTPQPVVECYMEPGKPPVMLLTMSSDFFAPFDTNLVEWLGRIVIDNAVAVVRHNGQTDTLDNEIYFDFGYNRFYNYVGRNAVAYAPGQRYDLDITLPDGNTITSSFVMPVRTPIDSVVVEFDPVRDSLARMLTYITDDPNQTQYYRRVLNYSSLTDSAAVQDFLVRDNLNTTNLIAFGTGYELKVGDTVYNTIYSVTEDHLNYVESVQLAVFGNQNPFASPSTIVSNVRGTNNPLGIFAPMVFDRDTTVVKK